MWESNLTLLLSKLDLYFIKKSSFNEAKTVLPFNQLNDDLFLQQTIWNNLYFKVKGKPLLFRNWLKSGIKYVKDLYDDDGNFHDIAYFSNIIVNKSNWLCEYKVLKNIFGPLSTRFDCSKGKYINIIHRNCFLFSNKYENIHDRKNMFFYDFLLKKKFEKPCFQTILSREFDITSTEWYSVH